MIVYFDTPSGASGDMILASLIDAGASIDAVQKVVGQVLPELVIETGTTHKRGLKSTTIKMVHEHAAATSYSSILDLIRTAGLDEPIQRRTITVLEKLARAESVVHGVDIDEVHFHELGAIDTIADIAGTAAALELLEIEEVWSSPLPQGRGIVHSQHGPLPIPAPATMEILRGVPIYGVDVEAELVTPTGAAILTTLSEGFGPIPAMKVRSVGYGAGSMDLEIPNVLRAVMGEKSPQTVEALEELLIEANIDDMNPELFEYASEKLFAAGADDVWLTPTLGKRGRPATMLSVLIHPTFEASVREVLMAETSTLGFRITSVKKWMAERDWLEVSVAGRPVRVKIGRMDDRVVNVAPEYSDCTNVARASGMALKDVYRAATFEAERLLAQTRKS